MLGKVFILQINNDYNDYDGASKTDCVINSFAYHTNLVYIWFKDARVVQRYTCRWQVQIDVHICRCTHYYTLLCTSERTPFT